MEVYKETRLRVYKDVTVPIYRRRAKVGEQLSDRTSSLAILGKNDIDRLGIQEHELHRDFMDGREVIESTQIVQGDNAVEHKQIVSFYFNALKDPELEKNGGRLTLDDLYEPLVETRINVLYDENMNDLPAVPVLYSRRRTQKFVYKPGKRKKQ